MILGLFFTLAGIVTLLIPEIPFICIGALILGPIELMIGLTGRERRRGLPESAISRPVDDGRGPPVKICESCGQPNVASATYCTECGAHFS